MTHSYEGSIFWFQREPGDALGDTVRHVGRMKMQVNWADSGSMTEADWAMFAIEFEQAVNSSGKIRLWMGDERK